VTEQLRGDPFAVPDERRIPQRPFNSAMSALLNVVSLLCLQAQHPRQMTGVIWPSKGWARGSCGEDNYWGGGRHHFQEEFLPVFHSNEVFLEREAQRGYINVQRSSI
jgi:hypothetical protein